MDADGVLTCGVCIEVIDDINKSLHCSGLCNKSFHYDCTSLKKGEIKLLENKNIKWFCDKCSVISTDVIGLLTSLKNSMLVCQDQILKQELTINNQHDESAILNLEISELRREINDLKSSNIDMIKLLTGKNRDSHDVISHGDEFSTVKTAVNNQIPVANLEETKNPVGTKTVFTARKVNNTNTTKTLTSTGADVPTKTQSEFKEVRNHQANSAITTSSPWITDEKKNGDENEWTEVRRKLGRKSSSRPMIRGTATSEITGLKAVPRRIYVYAGNFATSTSETDIMQYLNRKFPERKFEVEKQPKRDSARSVSFKITADQDMLLNLNNSDLWPKGILIKRFINLPNKGVQVSNKKTFLCSNENVSII